MKLDNNVIGIVNLENIFAKDVWLIIKTIDFIKINFYNV